MTNLGNTPDTHELKEGMFYVLDAPGINGAGSDSLERMQNHAEAGGRFIHKMSPEENGIPRLVDYANESTNDKIG